MKTDLGRPKTRRILINRTVIITGGRGCLARLFAPALAARGYDVQLISRTPGEGFLSYEELFDTDLLAKAAALIHLSWSTVPATAEQHPGIEWMVDLPLLARLQRKIYETRRRTKLQFIFFSSGGTVYGNAGAQPSAETHLLEPVGWHGAGKVAAEKLLEEFATRLDLRCTILRPSNPYGFPVPESRRQGIIPHLINAAIEEHPFVVWGDGSSTKDYLYFSDLLDAVHRVLELGADGTYNIASGQAYSINELITLVEKCTGKRVAVIHQDPYPWDVMRSMLDNRTFRALSSWKPSVALETGLQRTVDALGIKCQV